MSYRNYKLNWRPSPKDPRDTTFRMMRALRGAAPSETLPAYVNLQSLCSTVQDQGQTGQCTGEAVIAACEFLAMKRNNGVLPVEKSVKFAYYNGRRMLGSTATDCGCFIRTVIKAGARYGVCGEELWPEDKPFDAKPGVGAYADATRFRLTEYANIGEDFGTSTLNNIRATLFHGMPVCFGFTVYDSFMSDAVANTGNAPVPNLERERKQGGHAVLAVGYDDANERLIVRNSWSSEWGNKGYFTLPYWYIRTPLQSDDFWTITGQEEGNAKAGWFSGLGGYLFGHTERKSA